MSRCPVCRAEVDGHGVYCSASCRRTAARLRSDPLGTYADLLVKSRQRCAGCGARIPHKRLGARWCSMSCRSQHRDDVVQELVRAA